MTASFVGEDYLEVRDLTVDFDGFKAIEGVDVTFLQGRLHFLIGPNGAGKTTLVDALTGLVQRHRRRPSSATTNLLDDEVAQDRAPGHRPDLPDRDRLREAQRAAEPRHRRRRAPQGAGAAAAPAGRCPSASRRRWRPIGLTALADRPAGILAHGQKQWLEVGMLLVQDAKVMFLDETVAGMSAEEREETGELLQRIVGDRTIVVIEHDMEFMRTLRRLRDGACTPARCSPRGRSPRSRPTRKVQEVYLGTVTEVALDG